jgi:hypothetical protein
MIFVWMLTISQGFTQGISHQPSIINHQPSVIQ